MKTLILALILIPYLLFSQTDFLTISKTAGSSEDISIYNSQQIFFENPTGEDVMFIHLKDGSVAEYRLNNVNSIIFDAATSVDNTIQDVSGIENYPNPFSESTTIFFDIGGQTISDLRIFDLNGNVIKSFNTESLNTGKQSINWDGTNFAGEKVSQGIYYFQLRTGRQVSTKPVMIIR